MTGTVAYVLIIVFKLSWTAFADPKLYASRMECEEAFVREATRYASMPHFCEVVFR